MIAPVRTLLYGVTDRAQALEAARLGVDGIVVAAGEGAGEWLAPRAAAALLGTLPPLVGRLLRLRSERVPAVAHAVITRAAEAPSAAKVWIRCAGTDTFESEGIPDAAAALWIEPREREHSAATAYDFHRVERISRSLPLILESTDGAAGVETLIRLGRPHAVLLGQAVWHHPGIVDLARLEDSLAVVARLNKAAYR